MDETQLKAVFLYNFTKFVNWPDSAFTNPEAFLKICVLKDAKILEELETILKEEKFVGRPVQSQSLENTQTIKGCHVLFVGQTEQPHLVDIMLQVQKFPILTVSDMGDFVMRGGMIQFYRLEDKVRFSIDPETINEAGLKASAQLLKVANIVRHNN